jgi:hypothetical protein
MLYIGTVFILFANEKQTKQKLFFILGVVCRCNADINVPLYGNLATNQSDQSLAAAV